MNCPMCGATTDVTGPAHSCITPLGPATFTPNDDRPHQLLAERDRLSCEIDALKIALHAANLQLDELKRALADEKDISEARKKMTENLAQFNDKKAEELEESNRLICALTEALNRWLRNYDMNACTRQDLNEVIYRDSRKLIEKQKTESCGIMQYEPPTPCGLPLPCAVHDRNLDVDKRKCRCGADLTSQGHACAYFPSPTEKRNDETK